MYIPVIHVLRLIHVHPSDPRNPCFRSGYVVHLPVPEQMFQLLPREIQRGHTIKIVPVLFSIGINEQATIAERSVQRSSNTNNMFFI